MVYIVTCRRGTARTRSDRALVKSGSADVRICGCCVRIRAGISVRVTIRVRDGVRISNRFRRRVKLVNYSLITALPIATSADPHIRGRSDQPKRSVRLLGSRLA